MVKEIKAGNLYRDMRYTDSKILAVSEMFIGLGDRKNNKMFLDTLEYFYVDDPEQLHNISYVEAKIVFIDLNTD